VRHVGHLTRIIALTFSVAILLVSASRLERGGKVTKSQLYLGHRDSQFASASISDPRHSPLHPWLFGTLWIGDCNSFKEFMVEKR
jgi:hypothetical protein